MYPFFVIDPFDRGNFPSVESGLVTGTKTLYQFKHRISDSINRIEKGECLLE